MATWGTRNVKKWMMLGWLRKATDQVEEIKRVVATRVDILSSLTDPPYQGAELTEARDSISA